MDKKTKLSAVLFQEAKRQKAAGEISAQEYNDILTLLYDKLSDLENDQIKSNHLIKVFGIPNFKINIKDSIQFTLAMN